jgi:hypothetical protein
MLWVRAQISLYTVTPPTVALSRSRTADPGHGDIVTLDGHVPHVWGSDVSLSATACSFNGFCLFHTRAHGILKNNWGTLVPGLTLNNVKYWVL